MLEEVEIQCLGWDVRLMLAGTGVGMVVGMDVAAGQPAAAKVADDDVVAFVVPVEVLMEAVAEVSSTREILLVQSC